MISRPRAPLWLDRALTIAYNGVIGLRRYSLFFALRELIRLEYALANGYKHSCQKRDSNP